MTLADLIRTLQELNVDPSTPVRFFSNNYDADEPLIDLVTVKGRRKNHKAIGIHVFSDKLEEILDDYRYADLDDTEF